MGGFATAVGFMFSFFIIIFLTTGAFFIYQDQVIRNVETIEEVEGKFTDTILSTYTLSKPYYSSDRINFQIDVGSSEDLFFTRGNQQCFDFYINDEFIGQDRYKIGPRGDSSVNYEFIEQSEQGFVSIQAAEQYFGQDVEVKAISCSGVEYLVTIDAQKWDWWDDSWSQRLVVTVVNPSNIPLNEYQVETYINSSQVDFSRTPEEEIRVIIPYKEFNMLDLTFDTYSQTLQDSSKYDNVVVLGSTSGAEGSDPVSFNNGVISNALSFDGGDYLTISSDPSLNLTTELTYSAWINWADLGDSQQYIFTNGNTQNSLSIINDGGANDSLVEFSLNIDGVVRTIVSTSTIPSGDWTHVTATYDGLEMRLYVDGLLENNQSYPGNVRGFLSDNYVGYSGVDSFYQGQIDEVKIFNIQLSNLEVLKLYQNSLDFKELDFYIADWDQLNEKGTIFSKIPSVGPNQNITFYIYHDVAANVDSVSDIENTFSYKLPRTVAYLVNDRISGTTGASIFSLYDDNTIFVGDDELNLNEQQGSTLGTGSLLASDSIRMEKLGVVEGNGDAVDMSVPVSWASTDFVYRGFRAGTDRLCMLSPWGTSTYDITDNGVSAASGNVGPVGTCVDVSIDTSNTLRINSPIPILVSVATAQDAHVFYPATDQSLYGVPSQQLYFAASTAGASGSFLDSGGLTTSFSLGPLGNANQGGYLDEGEDVAVRIDTDGRIGALQQADSDGSESSVFVPRKEFGTLFGSLEATEYIAVVSDVGDANCTAYDSSGTEITSQTTGTGSNGIYKYDFGTGTNTQYAAGSWKLECEKPVWIYYEEDSDSDGDERNLFSYVQMRQFVHPEPIVLIN